MSNPLDNIFWLALSGAQLRFTTGVADARRYAPGFSPILGFADRRQPNFAGLASCCEPGEHFYCDGWSGSAPDGWRIDAESTMFRMAWAAPMPAADEAPDAVRLGPQHAARMLELATLTRPGPFGPRTPELGDYFGYFHGDRLVAMAGERLAAPGLREVSGVCTHPEFQGRGLARKLVAKLVRRHMRRGEQSFLHVMRDNSGAHRLYQRMGFEDYLESVVRVVSMR